jgi:hypothetical protein
MISLYLGSTHLSIRGFPHTLLLCTRWGVIRALRALAFHIYITKASRKKTMDALSYVLILILPLVYITYCH